MTGSGPAISDQSSGFIVPYPGLWNIPACISPVRRMHGPPSCAETNLVGADHSSQPLTWCLVAAERTAELTVLKGLAGS
jgi:hypothetical protein